MKRAIVYILDSFLKWLSKSKLHRSYSFGIDDLRFSTLSFSQFGEDIFIYKLLEKTRDKGIYIDFGAFHPKLFSLTYLLYLNGWRGITVDANPINIENHKKFRKDDKAILAAVGTQKGKALFAEYSDPATNRLIFPGDEDQKSITGLTPQKTSKVDVVLPMQLLPLSKKVDFLNIDCEGIDFEILKEIDLQLINPYLIAIESHDETESKMIADHLGRFKYQLVGRFFFTYIFERS